MAKTVLISGAGRGIGLTTATRLAAAGMTVLAGARSSDHLERLAAIPGVRALPLDVTDPQSVAALDDVLPDRLDAVVNNAGIAQQGPVEAHSPEDLAYLLDVNVVGALRLTQVALSRLRASGGRVVVVSSVSGLLATPGTGAYCASKFALHGLAGSLRIELRPWKIPVSVIVPAATRTDMWTKAVDDFDASVEKMSDAHRALYESQLTRTRQMLPRLQRSAVDPDRVARKIERALTDARPLRRYLCDGSRLQVVASYAPTAVTDAVLGLATRRR